MDFATGFGNSADGIDHFFAYTFKGTEDAVKEVLMPYLKAGLASRIHFDVPPSPKDRKVDMCGRHFDRVIRDCTEPRATPRGSSHPSTSTSTSTSRVPKSSKRVE